MLSEKEQRPGEALFLSIFSGEDDFNSFEFTSFPKFHDYYCDFLNLISENIFVVRIRTRNHPYSIQMTPENAIKIKQLINKNLQLST